jgi:hypothetical protein
MRGPFEVDYRISTIPSWSGTPLFEVIENGLRVVGIHQAGVKDQSEEANHGLLTHTIFYEFIRFVENRDEDRAFETPPQPGTDEYRRKMIDLLEGSYQVGDEWEAKFTQNRDKKQRRANYRGAILTDKKKDKTRKNYSYYFETSKAKFLPDAVKKLLADTSVAFDAADADDIVNHIAKDVGSRIEQRTLTFADSLDVAKGLLTQELKRELKEHTTKELPDGVRVPKLVPLPPQKPKLQGVSLESAKPEPRALEGIVTDMDIRDWLKDQLAKLDEDLGIDDYSDNDSNADLKERYAEINNHEDDINPLIPGVHYCETTPCSFCASQPKPVAPEPVKVQPISSRPHPELNENNNLSGKGQLAAASAEVAARPQPNLESTAGPLTQSPSPPVSRYKPVEKQVKLSIPVQGKTPQSSSLSNRKLKTVRKSALEDTLTAIKPLMGTPGQPKEEQLRKILSDYRQLLTKTVRPQAPLK